MKTTAEILSAHKNERGMTDTELADAIGASQSSVSAWVTGRRIPDDERLPAIARALGIELDELMAANAYAKRSRASSIDEAMALLTQLQTEVARLRTEVAELRELVPRRKSAGPDKRR